MYGWVYICASHASLPRRPEEELELHIVLKEILTSTQGFFLIKKMYEYRSFTWKYLCALHVDSVLPESRKGHQIFWNWIGRWLWAPTEMLVLKPSALESCRAYSLWIMSLAPITRLLSTKWNCFSCNQHWGDPSGLCFSVGTQRDMQ